MAEERDLGEPRWLWLAFLPLFAVVRVIERIDDLRQSLRLWPGPTQPIGCLTNDDVDALPDD